eukprot:g8005.t1
MAQKRVAIIGAGAAGLVCAKECIQEGLNVQMFEKYPYSGGLWVVDEVPLDLQELNVHEDGYTDMARKAYSSVHDTLQTNLSRFLMGFSDFPFDTNFPGSKDPRTFPGNDEVLRYLDAFKKEFELDQFISYETEVINVDRTDDSEFEWQVKINCKGEIKTLFFDSVAVCSGHHTVPQLPELKNIMGFGRPCLHSHLYRNPNRYKDKVVLILGSGGSGRDTALEISKVSKKVYFCAREWKAPYDMSTPFEVIENIECCDSISHCPAKGTVQLEDGTILTDVDEMLLCTGYIYDYPFLKDSGLISTAESFVYPVYKHIFHTKYPTLGFIGLIDFANVSFLTFECQSKYFARVILGRCQLPDYEIMMKDIDQHRQRLEENNQPIKHFHALSYIENPFIYKNEVLSLCDDCSALPSWRKELFDSNLYLLLTEPLTFRAIEIPSDIQAIIGAGAAGLICAKECIQEGLNVQIFEKHPYSGGMWVVDEVPLDLQELNVHEDGYKDKAKKVHSSIYDEMQTNLSRFVMGFSDFPFDTEFPGSKDPRTFPGTDEVLRYLDAFKKEFELDQFISYETEVIDIDRTEDSECEWQVKINCKGKIKTLFLDSVAVCSGHYTVPQLPELKNIVGFGRPCLHSHLYRNPNRYKDKVVLILGNGSSGRDIVIEIAEVAKKVYFCARKWKSTLDLSKAFEGIKNICCCKSISHCPAEGTVQLEDGTILTDVDEMLLCTGYSYDYPFLKNSGLISTAESFVYPIYKHIFHTKYPTLGFIGQSSQLSVINRGIRLPPGIHLVTYFLQVAWQMLSLIPHCFILITILSLGAIPCIDAEYKDEGTDIGTAVFISRLAFLHIVQNLRSHVCFSKGEAALRIGRDETATSLQDRNPQFVRPFGAPSVPNAYRSGPTRTLKYSGCSETHNTISAIVECSNAVRQNPDLFVNDYPCSYASWRNEVSGKSLGPLKTGPTIMRLAQLHTDDQARMNTMSHQGSDGSDLQTRADRVDLPWGTVGENVAVGFSSAKAVVMAWMCSPPHRKNLMSCDFSTIGVGAGVSSAGRNFYTQVFSCGVSEECSCGPQGGALKRRKEKKSSTEQFQLPLEKTHSGPLCGWVDGEWKCDQHFGASTQPYNPFGY